jgi:hypothetical protein
MTSAAAVQTGFEARDDSASVGNRSIMQSEPELTHTKERPKCSIKRGALTLVNHRKFFMHAGYLASKRRKLVLTPDFNS